MQNITFGPSFPSIQKYNYCSKFATKWLCDNIDSLELLADKTVLFTSNEVHFHLSGMVNKQNFRCWASENPQDLHEHPLHSDRVTVWCTELALLGCIFSWNWTNSVCWHTDHYLAMLRDDLLPELREHKLIPTRLGDLPHLVGESNNGLFKGIFRWTSDLVACGLQSHLVIIFYEAAKNPNFT